MVCVVGDPSSRHGVATAAQQLLLSRCYLPSAILCGTGQGAPDRSEQPRPVSPIATHLAKLSAIATRRGLPRRTVRLRLTLLYGGLFLASGVALLTITYLLVRHATGGGVLFFHTATGKAPSSFGLNPALVPALQGLTTEAQRVQAGARREHAAELHQLLIQSGIALAAMSVVSIALGWLVAGRVLAPLRSMTQQTRRVSERNLHERLALEGPGDELKELADTIDGLLARLEGAFDAQRRFVANASHELRTPLAMMRTSLDVATAKPGAIPPRLAALDVKLREGLNQAERLLESFLDLARAEHPQPAEQPSVSLPPLLVLALAQREREISAKGITVERSIREAQVPGSETLLARMLANVVDNAIRYNHKGGLLRVAAESDGARARISVQNDGPLLDEHEVRQLAQPFRRLGTERTGSREGVGLGLSIVAAIATAHRGTLELHARPSGGMDATIELPIARMNGERS